MKKKKMTRTALFAGIIAIAAMIGFGLSACSGDDGGGTHEHTWSQTWSRNATQHWKECTGADCDAKTGTANHAPSHGFCDTCYYTSHTYSSEWTYDGWGHWKECTGCSNITESAAHSLENDICLTCGYDNTPHIICTYSSEWTYDGWGHWKECTVCSDITESAAHTLEHGLCTICEYGTFAHTYVYTVTSTSYPAQSTPTCSCGETTGIARDTIIGDTGPAGGIIFYVASSGFTVEGYTGTTGSFAEYTAYYLEASPEFDGYRILSRVYNGSNLTGITTFTSTSDSKASLIGNGRKDTQIIVNYLATTEETGSAAQICASKTVTVGDTVFNDWFLPSLGELTKMYEAKEQLGIYFSSFRANFTWSSSMGNVYGAWGLHFFNHTYGGYYDGSVDSYARAVRAF